MWPGCPISFGDTGVVSLQQPAPPSSGEWARFGVSDVVELHAGKQSRVFAARVDGVQAAIKLTGRRFVDAALLEVRMAAAETIAVELAEVVSPQRLDGELVQQIGGWLMTATRLVTGEQLDPSQPDTGVLMGQTLARLHLAMAQAEWHGIPAVAALSTTPADVDRPSWQLLHGDFSVQNMFLTPRGIRVFDFDDCGHGPTEFDVANSLYMELFDAEIHDDAPRYTTFRSSFLSGYAHGLGKQLNLEAVDELIAVRISALGRWLEDLSSAPIGIRTSSPEWQDTLRSFVRSHT